MPLSDAKIRALKESDRDYKVADFDGLFLFVKKTGSRSWRFKYRVGGKEKLMVFGDYPYITLSQARALRDEAKTKLANGLDPNAEKQTAKQVEKAKASETFGAIADLYVAKAKAEQRAAATMAKTVWVLNMAKADFGSKPIRDITAPMILKTLRKLEAKGIFETAKRLRSKVGAVFRFAVASGWADTDPTYALREALIRPKVTPRAAITNPVRLGDLLRAIDGCKGQTTTRLALMLLAIVAQRPGELRQATWAEIDFENAIWTIPAERMKMRRPHQVPLPARAITILKDLQLLTGHGRFLFPSIRTGLRPISENTLNQSLRGMGFTGAEMTSHGFRATFATLANESGLWHADAIERALAHVDNNSIRRVYARGEYWAERLRLAEWWADFLEECRLRPNSEPLGIQPVHGEPVG